MIGAAGLIIAGFFVNLNSLSNLGANILKTIDSGVQNSTPGTADKNGVGVFLKSDIDKDGLPDNEEPLYRTDPLNPDTDGDGFLDGEEVATGCSPISASLKDCNLKALKAGLSQSKINLTEYFSSLVVGGLLANDLNKDNPEFKKYLATLQDETSQIQKTLLSVDETELKIEMGSSNSKEASQKYLDDLENILINHFLKKDGSGIRPESTNFDYSPYFEDAEKTYKELSELKPPKNWSGLHKKTLKFFFELKTYYSNLNKQKNDPVRALLTLKQTGRLIDDYEILVKNISEKIKEEGLETSVFNL